MDLGTALLALGTQVVKSACRLWLGDGAAGDMSDTVVDLLKDSVPDAIQRHRLRGMFEGFAGTVAEKARRNDGTRFHALAENERKAAILAAAETFQRAELRDETLFAVNLDARTLENLLRPYVRVRSSAWGLSEQGTDYFDFLLRECCSYLLEIKKTLPPFSPQALTELLRRTSVMEQQLAEVLERLPARTSMSGDEGFETDYRRQVVSELDYMDLFGASAFERSRGYPLSVAYISLLVLDADSAEAHDVQGIPVETALAESKRVFIRGEAGSGKTTLLQWIAVSAARREFPPELAAWNDLVPFFIRLRQFTDVQPLPRPDEFIKRGAAAMLAAESPPYWIRKVLHAGRGIVLIDGVDEVDKDRRVQISKWLRELIAAFPDSRFVITSRPAAVDEDWLERERFRACSVQPMTMPDIRKFIAHWHEAIASTVIENTAKRELARLAQSLSEQILARRHLRQLATNPLLCALLCALNRDRRAELPKNRIELYRISMEMFLLRRDAERQLTSRSTGMEYDDKLQLLQDLAYWMMTNGLVIAELGRVSDLVGSRLATRRHHIVGTTHEVVTYLLERSGLLREPVTGRIDFIHRTFQEYLAAQAAVDRDEIEALTARANDEQWRQVVILAAGLGNKRQTVKIFDELLNPPRRNRANKVAFELTALGCLETATEVHPSIADEIKRGAAEIIPPRSSEHVQALSRVGEYAYDLVADAQVDAEVADYLIQLARNLGGPGGIALLEKVSLKVYGVNFTHDFLQLWKMFEPAEYAARVLAPRHINDLVVDDVKVLPGLPRLPELSTLRCRLDPGHSDYTVLARMPQLRQATIEVTDEHLHLALAFPSKPYLVELLDIGRGGRSYNLSARDLGQALVLSGVDSIRTLSTLSTVDGPGLLFIDSDSRLSSLKGLKLPWSTFSLEVTECPAFTSLDGAEELIGSALENLAVNVYWPSAAVSGTYFKEAVVEPLFRPGAVGIASLVDQLRFFSMPVMGTADARADIDVLVMRLENIGFQVSLSGDVITARRRTDGRML